PRISPGGSPGGRASNVRKYPHRPGRPNSLLNEAAPIGPSSMISRADAMRAGDASPDSHGRANPGIDRWETLKPVSPAFGLPPSPVAPSSRISPPAPVA